MSTRISRCSRLFAVAALLAGVGILSSCAEGDKDSWRDVAKEAGEAASAAGDVAKEGVARLQEKLAPRLQAMEPKMAQLKEQISAKASETGEQLMVQWQELADARTALLEKVKQAGEDAPEALAAKIDGLEKSLRELQQKLAGESEEGGGDEKSGD